MQITGASAATGMQTGLNYSFGGETSETEKEMKDVNTDLRKLKGKSQLSAEEKKEKQKLEQKLDKLEQKLRSEKSDEKMDAKEAKQEEGSIKVEEPGKGENVDTYL